MSNTGAVAMVKRRLQSAVENSALKSISDTFSQCFEASILGKICGRSIEMTKASRLYRWLTAEPEPDVIVIDLRETYTVGPFISVLDVVTPRIAGLWRNSGLASVAHSLVKVFSGSTTARVTAKLLEPPAPPDDREQRE